MAFGSSGHFFGLSTDTKPVSPQSTWTYTELDTSKSYVVMGSAWVLNLYQHELEAKIGLPGVDGTDGEDGSTGPPGPPGASGAAGNVGPAGLQGLIGVPGVDGEDGEAGFPGINGAPGAAGAVGIQGLVGAPGVDGEDGDGIWPTSPSHAILSHNGFPGGTATFLRSDGSFASPTASASISQTEIDFGTTPVAAANFTVIDAAVTTSSKLLAQVSYQAPTGKDVDEIEMDDIQIRCQPGTGQFIMFIEAADGSYLADKFKINYQVGA